MTLTKTVGLAAALFGALSAYAATHNGTTRISVLDTESKSVVLDDSGVPKNCDGMNYDAYCHSSVTSQVTNTLLVEEDNGRQYRIACTADSKWSRCAALTKGDSFEAHKEKNGLTVYYLDDRGKPRKQLYALVAPAQALAAFPEPVQHYPVFAEPVTPPPQIVRQDAPAPELNAKPAAHGSVRCTFSSNPLGAEVILDGRYAGSTPSVLWLGAGPHQVIVANPGYTQWKRAITVTPGSELTINAILQK